MEDMHKEQRKMLQMTFEGVVDQLITNGGRAEFTILSPEKEGGLVVKTFDVTKDSVNASAKRVAPPPASHDVVLPQTITDVSPEDVVSFESLVDGQWRRIDSDQMSKGAVVRMRSRNGTLMVSRYDTVDGIAYIEIRDFIVVSTENGVLGLLPHDADLAEFNKPEDLESMKVKIQKARSERK